MAVPASNLSPSFKIHLAMDPDSIVWEQAAAGLHGERSQKKCSAKGTTGDSAGMGTTIWGGNVENEAFCDMKVMKCRYWVNLFIQRYSKAGNFVEITKKKSR